MFTANSGFHFAASGKSLVKKRILSTYPNQAENEKDFIKIPSGDSNKLYANRWRFVETPSNFDSNILAKTVTIVAHYTAPDYRDQDAKLSDGTSNTNANEILKNRGILIVPMLRKSTTALTAKIDSFAITKTFDEDAFGDDGVLTIYKSTVGNKAQAIIQGTSVIPNFFASRYLVCPTIIIFSLSNTNGC